ncbi:laccase [Salvia divinorum]|uniref:Laccase n=1 Tax=Salvia divinorum TaxID=28513 RepID=A0ABD1FWK4_SALDI
MLSTLKLLFLCFLGIVLLGGVTPSHAAVRRYRFELRNSTHSRLCNNKTMLTTNGQFPGPIIYARRGDLVIVDVINSANHNITIHWHGVKMPRYPYMVGWARVCDAVPY